MKLLTKEEIKANLAKIEDYWESDGNELKCQLTFYDFISAFSFMTVVAMAAEKLNHHPNWSNTYNKLFIELTTHDAGGLTKLDFQLAGIIDEYFKKYAKD